MKNDLCCAAQPAHYSCGESPEHLLSAPDGPLEADGHGVLPRWADIPSSSTIWTVGTCTI
ncbi:hypothetical protein HPG69_009394 [Diceros bicornis minor]|uniref:Uncharacterized protein n=1 Tax=Diceros bicornis minor TaxID=77932 RepID=A0A7J7F3K3_DICBM|nr:hypothetical protein HPG69_009394 [Diceros bicornis minor]